MSTIPSRLDKYLNPELISIRSRLHAIPWAQSDGLLPVVVSISTNSCRLTQSVYEKAAHHIPRHQQKHASNCT